MAQDSDIIDTIADDFNNEIVGNSSDYNGGRLTLSRSRDLAAQALGALRAAGYAILSLDELRGVALVRLPEPNPGWWDCYEDDGDPPDHNLYGDDAEGYVVTTWFQHPHEVQISHQGEPMEPISPAAARSFAAALLAAADKAEEGK